MQCYQPVAIVDDDAPTRKPLARLLRAHGIDSRNYWSARAFLEALSSDMPYCLIVDVQHMPDMTGIELQRELLKRDVRIPTIVISAEDDESLAAGAASLGAAAFLLKPVTNDNRVVIDDINIGIDTIKLDRKVCKGCGRRFLGRCVTAYCTKHCQMETRKRDDDVKDLTLVGKMLDALIQ